MSLTVSRIVLSSLMVIGLLAWGSNWLPAPAHADDEASEPRTSVSRSAADAEAEPRRSPEAEAGRRPTPEADAGRHRSAEGERVLEGFRPQTDREAALYQMILQLRREMAQMRRELDTLARRERVPARDADASASSRSRDREQTPSNDPDRKQLMRIYQAYDKDHTDQVSFAEFLAMREGADEPRVQAQAKESFKRADRNNDGHLSFEEFVAASQRQTEGNQPRREGDRPRDGDQPRREGDRPRDGDPAARDRE